uniref:Uncharacterized protein n=1 Tax=Anguilla anguilla TaxID=7936 RepID=A0A0E9UHP7_ANGAN
MAIWPFFKYACHGWTDKRTDGGHLHNLLGAVTW